MTYELTIYRDGSAILTDDEGESVWTSDNDDDFASEFPEVLDFDDGDAVAKYLEDAGIVPDGVSLDIVEAEGSLEEAYDDDDEDEDEDEE